MFIFNLHLHFKKMFLYIITQHYLHFYVGQSDNMNAIHPSISRRSRWPKRRRCRRTVRSATSSTSSSANRSSSTPPQWWRCSISRRRRRRSMRTRASRWRRTRTRARPCTSPPPRWWLRQRYVWPCVFQLVAIRWRSVSVRWCIPSSRSHNDRSDDPITIKYSAHTAMVQNYIIIWFSVHIDWICECVPRYYHCIHEWSEYTLEYLGSQPLAPYI